MGKKYLISTVPKYSREMVETEGYVLILVHKHERLLSWLRSALQWKEVEQVLWAETSSLSEVCRWKLSNNFNTVLMSYVYPSEKSRQFINDYIF